MVLGESDCVHVMSEYTGKDIYHTCASGRELLKCNSI